MNFTLSDDHEFLRDVARTFVANEISLAKLLIPGATVADASYAANWKKIVDVGWPGLIVPEAFGGSGMSCIDLAMIAGELGRALAPSPLLGTLAGTWAILRGGSDAQQAALLPQVASGKLALALAVADANGNSDGPGSDAIATADGDGFRIDGTKSFVIDGAAADVLVVAARLGTERRFFIVGARQSGASVSAQQNGAGADRPESSVSIEVLPWRDITRQVCTVRFSGARAELLPGADAEVWPWVRDRLLMVLSVENAAGIEHVLDATVAYAKERVAFGRPIGAYQSIKHALADTFGARECANAAALYAAWALSEDAPNATLAAAMAQAYTSDAYVAATHQSIQIFGALGFSWEMENHLYFKRARANAALFGAPSSHRARVVALATAAA
jgi:alkylation response protein AidB-like acyl-CoA dehydrogenase